MSGPPGRSQLEVDLLFVLPPRSLARLLLHVARSSSSSTTLTSALSLAACARSSSVAERRRRV